VLNCRLGREEEAEHIDVKLFVKLRFGDRFDRSELIHPELFTRMSRRPKDLTAASMMP